MQSIQRIKGSDGTENANLATVQDSRSPGSSTIVVDTVTGINEQGFEGSMGTPHTFTDPVTSETITVIDEATAVDFSGHVDGDNLEIDDIAPGYVDGGSSVGDIVVIRPTTNWANNLADVLAEQHKDDGSHGDITVDSITGGDAVFDSLEINGIVVPAGWSPLGVVPTTVVNNGNRSYTLTFADSMADTLDPGMRLRIARTVAAPTRCTSLNGSNQYYNKTSPSGMTWTDDFASGAWVKPSAYQTGTIISRYNGTSGWSLETSGEGTVTFIGFNGSSSNFRYITTYESLPLNRWTHVTAQLDMSAYTISSTTCYIMFNGIEVTASLNSGGTNPTALVQAGNLEIGSRNGGTQLFAGKIAQAFVTNAKITQANACTLMSQGLTASLITTHNIVSAYSFDNSIADLNTTTANDLTAQGSAVATNADSFAGKDANGSFGELDFALVTKVATTTVVVQVPEGCTIPTSGGIDSMDLSVAGKPFGFPRQEDRWAVLAFYYSRIAGSSSLNTWAGGQAKISAPIGDWKGQYDVPYYSDYGSGSNQQRIHYVTLSTTTNSETDINWSSAAMVQAASGNPLFGSQHLKTHFLSLAAATPYYIVFKESGTGGIANNNIFASQSSTNAPGYIRLIPACL